MENNLKKIQTFSNSLNQKLEQNYLIKFFNIEADPNTIYKLPILSKSGKKLNPVRNYICTKYDCLYNFDEILTKFELARFNRNYKFFCQNCSSYIELDQFFVDQTLKIIIDRIWAEYNEKEIQCRYIEIRKSGECKVLLEKKENKNEFSNNIAKNSKIINSEPSFKSIAKLTEKNPSFNINIDEIEKEIKKSKNSLKLSLISSKIQMTLEQIPSLIDFSENEFDKLKSLYFRKGLSLNSEFIEFYSVSLLNKALYQLYYDNMMSDTIVHFFLSYLIDCEQRRNKSIKDFFSAYVCRNSEGITLLGLSNVKQNKLKQYSKIFLCLKIYDHWVLACFFYEERDNSNAECFLYDLLDSDIAMFTKSDIVEYIKEIIKVDITFLKVKKFKFINKIRMNEYRDFGMEILFILYRYFEDEVLESKINEFFGKAEDFRMKILWTIFKFKEIISNQ